MQEKNYVKDIGGGYREINTGYTVDKDFPGRTKIPSRVGGANGAKDDSGMQLGGIDPTKPQPYIEVAADGSQRWVYPDKSIENKKEITPTVETKQMNLAVSKATIKSNNIKETDGIRSPEQLVKIHLPNMEIPIKVHEVVVDLDKRLFIMVYDSRGIKETLPKFEPTKESEVIIFSLPEIPKLFYCSFMDQSFTVAKYLNILVFLIEETTDTKSEA